LTIQIQLTSKLIQPISQFLEVVQTEVIGRL